MIQRKSNTRIELKGLRPFGLRPEKHWSLYLTVMTRTFTANFSCSKSAAVERRAPAAGPPASGERPALSSLVNGCVGGGATAHRSCKTECTPG